MTRPVLLTTVGSLGDLFPVLAVARALLARGRPVRLLLTPDDARVAARHGLEAIPFGPDAAQMSARLAMSRSEIAASVFRNPSPILRRATYPMLPDLVRAMEPHARDAGLIAGTALALAGPLAAEIAGRPYVPLLLQPTLLQSALDPPHVRGFVPPMVPRPRTGPARAWNRAWLRVVRLEMRRRHGRAQDAVRRTLGLGPTRATPLFGSAIAPRRRIGLWDPVLQAVPADARPLDLTGFAMLDQGGTLPPDLSAFLDAGPPPLIVTLGSVAHDLHGAAFWHEAVALARRAGLRAVLLSGEVAVAPAPDLCAVAYAPHGALFPRGAAILHHGGMGTLGQALASGRPQLILPVGADQPDNADRVARLGVGRRIGRPDRADVALAHILSEPARRRAAEVAATMIGDGADRAAEALLSAL